MSRRVQLAIGLTTAVLLGALPARGQKEVEPDPAAEARAREPESGYVEYGVALTAEAPVVTGPICDAPGAPCILGSGGGVGVRVGHRSAGNFYLGGAYELSKQDSTKLYKLGILQQLRAEGRYYVETGRNVQPFGQFGAGVAGYGNEWGIDTWGPMGSFGLGVEFQVTRTTVVGLGLSYRLLFFKSFTDSARTPRDSGVAQLIGFEVFLEARDPL